MPDSEYDSDSTVNFAKRTRSESYLGVTTLQDFLARVPYSTDDDYNAVLEDLTHPEGKQRTEIMSVIKGFKRDHKDRELCAEFIALNIQEIKDLTTENNEIDPKAEAAKILATASAS